MIARATGNSNPLLLFGPTEQMLKLAATRNDAINLSSSTSNLCLCYRKLQENDDHIMLMRKVRSRA